MDLSTFYTPIREFFANAKQAFATDFYMTPVNTSLSSVPDSAAANNSWKSSYIGFAKYVGIQINIVGIDTADAVVKLQDSIDGVNWVDITSATITLAAGNSSNMFRVSNFSGKFIKVDFTHGTAGAGTIEVLCIAKK